MVLEEVKIKLQEIKKLNGTLNPITFRHVDWMIETIEKQQEEITQINQSIEKLKDTVANDVFAVLCDITRRGKNL
jgi:t-SNARE complex subunit (syntaxin)